MYQSDDASGKPMLRALSGQASERIPCWFMRQAGRYLPEYRELRYRTGTFLDTVFNPEVAAEITLQPVRRFSVDAAILFSDILVIPHALGQTVDFVEGEGPQLSALDVQRDLGLLDRSGLHARLSPIYETMARVVDGLPAGKTAIGFAGSPWTVACYMVEGGASKDFAKVKQAAFGNPTAFGGLMEILVDATAAYLLRQIEAGAEVVQLFDSWSGILPEAAFIRWVVEPTAAIVDRVRSQTPGVPIIGFPRAAGQLYDLYADAAGVDALGLDPGVPLSAARRLQAKLPVQGNLDPIWLLTGGPGMVEEAHRILDGLGSGPFVFNLGHGILPSTPPDNVALLTDLIHTWPRR